MTSLSLRLTFYKDIFYFKICLFSIFQKFLCGTFCLFDYSANSKHILSQKDNVFVVISTNDINTVHLRSLMQKDKIDKIR